MNCPICNSEVNNTPLDRYIFNKNNINYQLFKCNNCELEFWEPLKMIKEFYEEEVFDAYALFHYGVRTLYSNHLMFFKYFPLRSGRLLDVGCGEGIFIREAKKLGFEVWGIDFDRKSIEVAKNKFGLNNVYAMSLEEFVNFAKEKNIKFDVITFFEVLEHQDKPREFLEQIKSLLKPNGYIAGSVPNKDGFFKRLGGLPPHHFLWFSKNSLNKILKIMNFKEIKIFYVEESLKELSSHTQAILSGNMGLKIRNFLIKKIFNFKPGKNYFENEKNIKNAIIKFKIIKNLRDLIFLPLAIILKPLIKNRGLYFQAKI